jgi:2-iminobutanoate/2-iminopropanoate deaminase
MLKPLVSSFTFPWAENLHASQAVRAGDLVFTAGQAGFLPDGTPAGDDAESQCRQAFANLDEVLRAQGASIDSVIRISAYLADAADFPAYKRVRDEVLQAPYPASTVLIAGFVLPGMLVEIEAVATVGGAREIDAG